jgi:EAL domain-containing protein (putative c-di-GMP-specific phosphodiesterase class I)/ActR/RegA family two-component response regulator
MTTILQKILIIDDDLDVCDLISSTAADLGVDCTVTTDAESFFGALTPNITLVMLDLVMPETDGIQILRQLSERQCRAGIVLMSGISKRVIETAEALTRTLGLSVVGHLSKPFRINDLEEILTRYAVSDFPPKVAVEEVSFKIDELWGAVEREEFVLHYQPQIQIETNQLVGIEALVRWQHPSHGLIYPDNFIEYAEEFDLIDPLTWIVIKRGLSEMGSLKDQTGSPITLSLNLSVLSLLDLAFPDKFILIAGDYGVAPENVMFEITESGLIRELSRTLDVLTRLRMKKVKLSIDDFGTGYSMMQQLSHIPANQLKIDKSFVMNLQNDSDRIMVEKTIEIGHELAMTVVAEGVETPDQLDFLRKRNCDVAQGYLFTKPLPKSEFLTWAESFSASQVLNKSV